MRNNRIRNIFIIAGIAIVLVIGVLVFITMKGKKNQGTTYPTSTWNTGESVQVSGPNGSDFDEIDPFKDIVLDETDPGPDYEAISGSDVVTLPFVPADQL